MTVEELEKTQASSVESTIGSPALEQETTHTAIHPWWTPDVLERHPDALEEKTPLQSTESGSSGGVLDQAKSLANWLWGVVFPSSRGEQTDEKSASASNLSGKMVGDMPLEEYQRFVNEMRHLLARIKDFNDEFGDELAFEKLLNQVYKAQIHEREDERIGHFDLFSKALQDKRNLNQERLQKLDSLIDKKGSYKWWGAFTTAATALGIGAVGTTITGGTAMVGFLIAVGLSADAMMEDWTKKKLVSLVTDDTETANKYTHALQLGCAVASLTIFIGLGVTSQANISGGLQVATSVAQGTSTAGQGYSRYATNCSQADLQESNQKMEKKGEQMKKATGKIKSLVTTVHDYYRNLSEIQRSQLQATMAMARA